MSRNEIPGPLLGGLEDFHPRFTVTLLLHFRLGAFLAASSVLHVGLVRPSTSPSTSQRLLPSVSLPSVPRTAACGRFLGPGSRPTGDVSQRVVVGPPRGDHLAGPFQCYVAYKKSTQVFLQKDLKNK